MAENKKEATAEDFKRLERQIYISAKDLIIRIDDTCTTWQPIRETNHQIIGSIIKEATAMEKKKSDKEKKKRKETTEEEETDQKPAKSQCSLWHGLSSTTTMVCSTALSKDTEKNLESMVLAVKKRDTETDKLVSICGFWNNIMENDRKYVESLRFQIQEYKDVVERYKELGDRIIAAQDIITMEENQEVKTLCNRGTILSDVVLGHVPVPSSDHLEKEISDKITKGTLVDDLQSVTFNFDKFQKLLMVPSQEQLSDITKDMKRVLVNLHSFISSLLRTPDQEKQTKSVELLENLEEEIIEWYVQRKRASEELKTIINQLKKHQAKTHKARTSGKITLCLGYVLDVIGAVLVPVTFGGSIGLMAVGVSLSLAGHSTDSAALAVHKKMTKRLCEAALEILKADQEKVKLITELLDSYKACIKAAKGIHSVTDVRQSLIGNPDEDISSLKIISILIEMEKEDAEEAAINLASRMTKTIVTPSLERNLEELREVVRTKGPSLLAQEFGLAQGKLYVPSSFEIGIIIHAIITSLDSITEKTTEHHHDDTNLVFSETALAEGTVNSSLPLSEQSSNRTQLNNPEILVSDASDNTSTNLSASVQKRRPVPKPRKSVSKAKAQDNKQAMTEEKSEVEEEMSINPILSLGKPQVQTRKTFNKTYAEEQGGTLFEESINKPRKSDSKVKTQDNNHAMTEDQSKVEEEMLPTPFRTMGKQQVQAGNTFKKTYTEEQGSMPYVESINTLKSEIESIISFGLSDVGFSSTKSNEYENDNMLKNEVHSEVESLTKESNIEIHQKTPKDTELNNNEINEEERKCMNELCGGPKNTGLVVDRKLSVNNPFGITGGGIDVSHMNIYRKTTVTSSLTRRIRLSDCFEYEDSQNNTQTELSMYEDIKERGKPSERLNRLKCLMKDLKGELYDSSEYKSHHTKDISISYGNINSEGKKKSHEKELKIENPKPKSKFSLKIFKKKSSNKSKKGSNENNETDSLKSVEISNKKEKGMDTSVKNTIENKSSNVEETEVHLNASDENITLKKGEEAKQSITLPSDLSRSKEYVDDINRTITNMQTVSQNLKEIETKIQENKKEIALIIDQPQQIPVSGALFSGNESGPDTKDIKISKHLLKGISLKSRKYKRDVFDSPGSKTGMSQHESDISKCDKLKEHKRKEKSKTENSKISDKDYDIEHNSNEDCSNEDEKERYTTKSHKKKKDSVSKYTSGKVPVISYPMTSPFSPPISPPSHSSFTPNQVATFNPAPAKSPGQCQSNSFPDVKGRSSHEEVSPELRPDPVNKESQKDTSRPRSTVLSCQWPKEPVSNEKTPDEDTNLDYDSDDFKDFTGESKTKTFGTKLARLSLRKRKKTKQEKKKQTESLLRTGTN